MHTKSIMRSRSASQHRGRPFYNVGGDTSTGPGLGLFLASPLKVQGRRRMFNKNNNKNNVNANGMNTRNDGNVTPETHHIIKFKADKPVSSSSKGRDTMNNARQAIKKRMMSKKKAEAASAAAEEQKQKSLSYASDSRGIEASIGMTRSETFMNKVKLVTVSTLKKGTKYNYNNGDQSTHQPSRGRSIERKTNISAVPITRSLSRKAMSFRRSLSRVRSPNTFRTAGQTAALGADAGDRSLSKRAMSFRRSLSRVRLQSKDRSLGGGDKPNFLEKVKSFRRDKSVASVRSARSARSPFSVRSRKGKGFFRFFRRKNAEKTSTGENLRFVRQNYYAPPVKTAPPTPEDSPGLFESLICTSLDVGVCRDLFCQQEDISDVNKSVEFDIDDPRCLMDTVE